jgi:hypothetical protein
MEVMDVFRYLFSVTTGGKMPKQKLQLTKKEDQEYRARLLRLEEMGIPIGCADDPSPEPERLVLKQIQHDSARIYDLPSGEVAVVVLAKLTIPISGILITDVEITLPWDAAPLELSDRWESNYYQDLIDRLPYNRTKVLNDLLTSEAPLGARQVEGAIVAQRWISFPPNSTTRRL